MIRFAVFTDLHCDYMFDWKWRLEQFIARMKGIELDFVVGLGDVCCPTKENEIVRQMLREISVPLYYTVGNHDVIHFSLEEVQKFWGMDSPYYSFRRENTKFLVLNSCYMQKAMIPRQELEWLERELEEGIPCVLFSHHSLVNDFHNRGIVNREEVRALFQGHRVLLCMNGHDHGDDCRVLDRVPYFTLNAMSSSWFGGGLGLPYYDKALHDRWPVLKDMIVYRDPLYALVEIEGAEVRIYGQKSEYQKFTPEEVGFTERKWNGISIEPRVSDFWARF